MTLGSFLSRKSFGVKSHHILNIYLCVASAEPSSSSNININTFSDAHEQMAALDVLVCGQCHTAFHFLEEFKEHKEGNACTGKSPVKDSVSQLKN